MTHGRVCLNGKNEGNQIQGSKGVNWCTDEHEGIM